MFRLLILLTLAFTLTACASLRFSEYDQAVFIQSDPPGAKVMVEGREVGTTPQYVLVRRSYSPDITVYNDKEEANLELSSNYRWQRSFFPNLVWLTLAPVGWGIDLLTGNAWDVDDGFIKFSNGARMRPAPRKPEHNVIAIAPPQAASLGLSDAGGRAIENALISSNKSKAIIRPYKETLPTFIAYHYDYDGRPDDPRDLHYHLKADAIYESTIETRGDEVVLRANKVDIITEKVSDSFELTLPPETTLERAFTTGPLQRLLPNTIGVDFLNESLTVSQGEGTNYNLAPYNGDSIWEKSLSYLSALNISNLPGRRVGRAGRWQFTLIPSIRLARRDLRGTNLPQINGLSAEQHFRQIWISGGYGPEVGFQVSRHYFYVNLVPQLFWNQVSSDRPSGRHRETGTGAVFRSEIGYLFFFNNNWNVRLFARSQGEDTGTWEAALRPSLPANLPVSAATSNYGGISIGYRFEPSYEGRWRRAGVRRR